MKLYEYFDIVYLKISLLKNQEYMSPFTFFIVENRLSQGKGYFYTPIC